MNPPSWSQCCCPEELLCGKLTRSSRLRAGSYLPAIKHADRKQWLYTDDGYSICGEKGRGTALLWSAWCDYIRFFCTTAAPRWSWTGTSKVPPDFETLCIFAIKNGSRFHDRSGFIMRLLRFYLMLQSSWLLLASASLSGCIYDSILKDPLAD